MSVLPWTGTPSIRGIHSQDFADGIAKREVVDGVTAVEQRAVNIEEISVGSAPR